MSITEIIARQTVAAVQDAHPGLFRPDADPALREAFVARAALIRVMAMVHAPAAAGDLQAMQIKCFLRAVVDVSAECEA